MLPCWLIRPIDTSYDTSSKRVGTATVNVGPSGAAFGVADDTTLTVMDLLLATDARAAHGILYSGDLLKRKLASALFDALNEAGDID